MNENERIEQGISEINDRYRDSLWSQAQAAALDRAAAIIAQIMAERDELEARFEFWKGE